MAGLEFVVAALTSVVSLSTAAATVGAYFRYRSKRKSVGILVKTSDGEITVDGISTEQARLALEALARNIELERDTGGAVDEVSDPPRIRESRPPNG